MNKFWTKIFMLSILACIWGSSFILMKRGMYAFDGSKIFTDKQVASLRMCIASIVLFPFFIKSISKLGSLKNILFLSIVGICGNFIPAFLFTYAETYIDSAYAGLLNSFTPIFTLLIGTVIFRQNLKFKQVIGVLVSVAGLTILLTYGQGIKPNKLYFVPSITIVFATFLYGISLNTIKHKLAHLKSTEISSLAFGILFLPSIFLVFSTDTINVIKYNSNALQGLFFISILSVFGTALALIIYNRLISISNTLYASSVTFLIPIVAIILGSFAGEEVNFVQLFSILIVLFGIVYANYIKVKDDK